jgi:hypothetical protein
VFAGVRTKLNSNNHCPGFKAGYLKIVRPVSCFMLHFSFLMRKSGESVSASDVADEGTGTARTISEAAAERAAGALEINTAKVGVT